MMEKVPIRWKINRIIGFMRDQENDWKLTWAPLTHHNRFMMRLRFYNSMSWIARKIGCPEDLYTTDQWAVFKDRLHWKVFGFFNKLGSDWLTK